MGERKISLPFTIGLAALSLVAVSAALITLDPRTNGAEALRTGGLAAGSLVGLYALWLNDRRRRIEEDRHLVERDRHTLEGVRVADERFARAVELLGHETDQVRVGALHALAGLARGNPNYTQTVLDVLCSYLRRPFEHPRYDEPRTPPVTHSDVSPTAWSEEASNDAERKLQVRLTAQRLIAELLPSADDPEAPAYDLDLTNATLEYFDVPERRIGTLTLRHARLFSSNNFSRCEFHGPAWFTGSTVGSGRLSGRFRCDDAVFRELAWFSGVTFTGRASFARTRFDGAVKFADSRFEDWMTMAAAIFHDRLDFREVRCDGDVDLSSTQLHGDALTSGLRTSAEHDVRLPEDWPTPDRESFAAL